MSYSNRPGKRPDPTITPNRAPFTPSARKQAEDKNREAARKQNRNRKRGA